MSEKKTGWDLEADVLVKAFKDEAFMELLKKDPKKAISNHLGISIDASHEIETVVETESKSYFVIPNLDIADPSTISDEVLKDMIIKGTCRNTGTLT